MADVALDTSFFISLWKVEAHKSIGIPRDYYSRRLMEHLFEKRVRVIVSTLVMEELSGKYKFLEGNLKELLHSFKDSGLLEVVEYSQTDKALALGLKQRLEARVSWQDCVHVSLAKQRHAVFITWDEALKLAAREIGVKALDPYEFVQELY